MRKYSEIVNDVISWGKENVSDFEENEIQMAITHLMSCMSLGRCTTRSCSMNGRINQNIRFINLGSIMMENIVLAVGGLL